MRFEIEYSTETNDYFFHVDAEIVNKDGDITFETEKDSSFPKGLKDSVIEDLIREQHMETLWREFQETETMPVFATGIRNKKAHWA